MFRLEALGGLAIVDESRAQVATQHRRLALLALLAAGDPRGLSRAKLQAYLWPESAAESARHGLEQLLYYLRRQLAPDAFLGQDPLRLNPAVVSSDVSQFRGALTRGAPAEAAALYRGPFLDGFFLSGAPEFERWAEEQRDRLAAEYREALYRVAQEREAQGLSTGAAEWWRKLLAADPLSTAATLGLMRASAAAGDRVGALRIAREHSAHLERELGAPPSPEVTSLMAELRRASPSRATPAESEPASHPAEGPPTSSPETRSSRREPDEQVGRAVQPRRRRVALALGALAALALAVAVVLLRSRAAPATLDAGLVAVAPFDVLEPKLQLWREGLMDVLARNLDGAGPLRTVSPTVVIRRWSGRADRTSATALGRRMGAELALYGQLVGSGPDSVRLTVSVLDVSRGAVLGEVELRGTADHMDQLADSLTVSVLRKLGETRPIRAARSGGLGSGSLVALRTFLRGEQYFRRTQWESARASYEEAIALDTAFALAYWRLGTIRQWQYGSGDSLGHAYSRRAAALNRGLPPRESLLLTCDSLMSTLEQAALPGSAGRENLRRLFAATERVTGRYASDPEAWVALGEARFHWGAGLGVSDVMTLEAFEKAIELDSAYAPAYIHAIQLALYLSEPAAARQYLKRYLDLRPAGQTALAAWATSLLLNSAVPVAQIDRVLDTIPSSALVDTWLNFILAPDSAEIGIEVARRLAGRSTTEDTWWRDSLVRQGMLAVSLSFRGHLQEAAHIMTAQPEFVDWPLFTELAMAGAIPADSVTSLYGKRLEKQPFWSPPGVPGAVGFLMAPAWWAAQGDTASLKRYIDRLGGEPPSAAARLDAPRNSYWRIAGQAYLALARGDTATALARLTALPDSTGPVWLERLTLAHLLSARGREREALSVLDREFPDPNPWASRGIWALKRARLAEKVGQGEKARFWYGYVVALWRRADPDLQPYVAEARAALGRLGVEARR